MPIKRKKPKNVFFWRYAQWYQHLARRHDDPYTLASPDAITNNFDDIDRGIW